MQSISACTFIGRLLSIDKSAGAYRLRNLATTNYEGMASILL